MTSPHTVKGGVHVLEAAPVAPPLEYALPCSAAENCVQRAGPSPPHPLGQMAGLKGLLTLQSGKITTPLLHL